MSTRKEKHKNYEAFVEKFQPKKTTDDCYTPPEVYEAVKDWAVNEYGLHGREIVRPFWPGGDYENYEYPSNAVVIDNPPFSMLAQIVDFYTERNIPFFLFAPGLTMFSILHRKNLNAIVINTDIKYENGAKVKTGFVTSFGEYKIKTSMELSNKIKHAVKNVKKTLQNKYAYPNEVLTFSDCERLVRYGQNFGVKQEDVYFIRQLDSQKEMKKVIYGCAFLLSEKAAAEKAAAEKAAAEKAAVEKAAAEKAAAEKRGATIWELSDRELEIIKAIGKC